MNATTTTTINVTLDANRASQGYYRIDCNDADTDPGSLYGDVPRYHAAFTAAEAALDRLLTEPVWGPRGDLTATDVGLDYYVVYVDCPSVILSAEDTAALVAYHGATELGRWADDNEGTFLGALLATHQGLAECDIDIERL